MIKIEDCKDGYLYHIKARNARFGIWRKEDLGFVIRREKFKEVYLFTEYHWDVGTIKPELEHFGTVTPLKEIVKAPVGLANNALISWLEVMANGLKEERDSLDDEESKRIRLLLEEDKKCTQ